MMDVVFEISVIAYYWNNCPQHKLPVFIYSEVSCCIHQSEIWCGRVLMFRLMYVLNVRISTYSACCARTWHGF